MTSFWKIHLLKIECVKKMKFHCTPKIRVTNYIIPQVQIEKCNSYRFPQELQINSLINFYTMWCMCFNGHVDPYQIKDFKPKVTTFTHKESFFLSSYILFWDLEINVIRMCITNTFQIKILPKYWNVFLFLMRDVVWFSGTDSSIWV